MRPLPAVLCACALVAGCGDRPNAPIPVPSYDPEAMSREAVRLYDRNGSGALEAAELDACPGLKSSLAAIDTNRDGKLSADELKARFEDYARSNAGSVALQLSVTLDGHVLPGATLTLTPEPFMGGSIPGATAVTKEDGSATEYTVGTEARPGVPPGVYKVAVTKDGASIPTRYNTQTALGCEASGGGRGGTARQDFKLTSR